MSYNDFLNTLISPIRLFISSISQVADSLIHNYIFITLIGISLFFSLFWFIYNIFFLSIDSKRRKENLDFDNKHNYKL